MCEIRVFFVIALIFNVSYQLPIAVPNVESLNIVPELKKNVTDLEKNEIVVRNDDELGRTVIRPGLTINSYDVELEPNEDEGTFSGTVNIVVNLIDTATLDDPILFHVSEIEVTSVQFAIGGGTNFMDAAFDVNDDDILTIETGMPATLYRFLIEYEGSLDAAYGLYSGHYDGTSYLAMNLHPTNARRVFPCVDELTEASIISFTINGADYTHLVGNSALVENSQTEFRPLQGPPHLWGIMAHNFQSINTPIANVALMGRSGVSNQDNRASVAINSFMTWLNDWTQKNYFEIITNQDGRMHVIAVPDVSTEWHSLSIVGVWEPHILMPINHAVMQRKDALVAIAKAMSRQWFGYVIYPENWIHNWLQTGIGTYAAYEAVKELETNPAGADDTLLDVDTMFVTDVIQESLLRDSYASALVLQPAEFIYDENAVRSNIHGLVDYKAPAVISNLRLVLGNADTDFVKIAARGLFISRSLQTVNTLNFIDAINSQYATQPNRPVGDVQEFLQPYISSTGYPVVNVHNRQGGVTLTQQHFSFTSPADPQTFQIPISFTRSADKDFTNIHPFMVLNVASFSHDIAIGGEEDWVIYNIQGRGYYRVNYDNDLMERLILALDNPDRRNEIHPLNRATLVDDSLNLARGGLLNYDLAFRLVLTMQHEKEYAVWKAFIRNMDFLRKQLTAKVQLEDDLDMDIYLRMVRRTVGLVENELGFEPDTQLNEPAMTSLARGIVMDHACRAGYDPCIAAAVDWFYDPAASEPTVNPNIPHDIRPAVFCTMVREGGAEVITALYARLTLEPAMYERVVILESLGCSEDEGFINSLLQETITANSRYSIEERNRIFKAVASSSHDNAGRALQFLSGNTNAIRENYGGPEKLEDIIFALADNMASGDLADNFQRWVFSTTSNLGDSEMAAQRAHQLVAQNLAWSQQHLDNVYEWIDLNDATTAALSMFLVCITLALTLFNH